MASKWSWVLGAALAWAGTDIAWAQGGAGQDSPKAKAADSAMPAGQSTDSPPAVPREQPPLPRAYASADYILWWVRRGPLPLQPLVTTGDPNQPNAGILGASPSATQSLFGGGDALQWGGSSGIRINAGLNLGEGDALGLEMSGFLLPRQSIDFNVASTGPGVPLISRPIFDNLNHVESVYDVSAFDPVTKKPRVSGRLDLEATTEMWGYEINITAHPGTDRGANIDLYGGFRSMGLDEQLRIRTDSTPGQPGLITFNNTAVDLPTDHVIINDFFGTTNRFYGPQIGGGFNWQVDRLGATLTGKIAAGVNHQRVTINGDSALVQAGTETNRAVGGILAQKSNIGEYSRDEFCLVPELGVQVDYAIARWLRVRFGYNLLYWSSVVRPGSQIDRNIDITQVPTDQRLASTIAGQAPPTIRPAFTFRDTDLWVHGLTVGVEVRY